MFQGCPFLDLAPPVPPDPPLGREGQLGVLLGERWAGTACAASRRGKWKPIPVERTVQWSGVERTSLPAPAGQPALVGKSTEDRW